ncbi:MAG: hypothetical protein ACRD0K_11155 [Egibacteraceae bacterium]
MIITEESTIRVERDERRMWVEAGAPVIGSLGFAAYLAALADRPVEYLPVVGVIALGVLLLVSGIRRRHLCVIEPTRIGFGFLGGRMWWLDRDRIGSVRVRQGLMLEVLFCDRDGKMFDNHAFACFDPKELRQAFESAGIPVR